MRLEAWNMGSQDNFPKTHLKEHATHEGHLLIDGGTAEDVTGSQGQWNMLDHVCQELEALQVAHEVIGGVNLAQTHKDILE